MRQIQFTTSSGTSYRLDGSTLSIIRTDRRGGQWVGFDAVVPDGVIEGVDIVGAVVVGDRATFRVRSSSACGYASTLRTTPVVSIEVDENALVTMPGGVA